MNQDSHNHVTAYKCGKHIDSIQLKSAADTHGLHLERFLDAFVFTMDGNTIITFFNGSVVQWGTVELNPIVREIVNACTTQPLQPIIEQSFKFQARQKKFSIENDVLSITSLRPLYLVSISHALARSVQLEYNESIINSVFTAIQSVPLEMKQYGKMRMKNKQIRKLIGLVMDTKHSMSVSGLVEDKPELLWEEPSLIPVYKETARYLELRERWEVVSEKIQYLDSMFTLLRDEIHIRQSHALEWIIIWLIVLEVVLAFFH